MARAERHADDVDQREQHALHAGHHLAADEIDENMTPASNVTPVARNTIHISVYRDASSIQARPGRVLREEAHGQRR